ncbi:hypothetical protein U7230_07790 [Carboxydochorda subterranea]|uniref:Uncharacterized protein n=1 Tax=Carboxydichorda subterranea TaxID=3109565 RepID=A0ABZ1BTN7_9FIRM|nr:hypothetical protein [Limnochorda sp. L945t]WRP16013.1 hypothetical protein U7230_07790 [Limnochorda sp. L945t]
MLREIIPLTEDPQSPSEAASARQENPFQHHPLRLTSRVRVRQETDRGVAERLDDGR